MSNYMHPGLCILYAIGIWVIFIILLFVIGIIIDKITRQKKELDFIFTAFKIGTAVLSLFAIMSLCVWIFVPCHETLLDTKVDTDTKEITSTLKYTKVINENGVTAITSSDGYVVISGDNYLCFYKTPEGIREQKIPSKSESTVIVYTNETPQLCVTTTVKHYRDYWWFFYSYERTTETVQYELRIPEGSLTT